MSKAIQGRLLEQLTNRGTWEQRQRIWYEMLHDGLVRRNKPFPGAANLHEAIGDAIVGKTQPYYVNAVFSRQTVASFTPLELEHGDTAAAAAQCLDWKLREESNFPTEFTRLQYYMLGFGRGILKCRWDLEARGGKGRLDFEAIDPLFFIPQPEQDDPDKMDLFAHVQQISVAKYKRTAIYNQDAELLELIRGGENQASQWKDKEKEMREGLTSTNNKELIILWEAWERVQEGWRVKTFGPGQPDRPVRPDFIFPLKWQGEPLQPFVAVQCELREKGWYAPRGLVEKVAPLEAYATKMRNQKSDWLEFCKNPLFTRDASTVLGNSLNMQLKPGDALPPGVAPAVMPPPPFALDEEINSARMQAEELAQVPDFGVSPEGDKKETRTATEMQYIGSFASQTMQFNAFISSLSEGKIYLRAWALLVANASKELTFYAEKTRKVLPEQAAHDNYLVKPDASLNTLNKAQRSVGRFQMLKGHPNVNQEELVKCVLEDDDPRLVKRLFISSGTKAASESEDEAIEIGILLEGYPAAVMPGEDHVTRLQMLFGKLQQLSMMPPPTTPEEMQRFVIGRQRMQEHIAAHVKQLQAENPAMAKQFMGAIGALENAEGGAGSAELGNGATQEGISATPMAGGQERIGSGLPGVSAGQPALGREPRLAIA